MVVTVPITIIGARGDDRGMTVVMVVVVVRRGGGVVEVEYDSRRRGRNVVSAN
jgi:hypothetical protein